MRSPSVPLSALKYTLCPCVPPGPRSPAFHNEKYIWPVDYRATRCVKTTAGEPLEHTFEILEGQFGPVFQITPHAQVPKWEVIRCSTPSGAWALLVELLGHDFAMTQRSGPQMFGFIHPKVLRRLQDLPDAPRLARYKGWLEVRPGRGGTTMHAWA